MEVILQQDVKNLGKKGDTVKVAEGYARNFLIPRGIAVEATASNLKQLQQEKKVKAQKAKREEAEARDLAKKLEAQPIVIKARTGDSGKLFGSVTSNDIVEALEKKNISIDKRKIQLPEPIKTLGSYTIPVKLYPGVTADLTVRIEGE